MPSQRRPPSAGARTWRGAVLLGVGLAHAAVLLLLARQAGLLPRMPASSAAQLEIAWLHAVGPVRQAAPAQESRTEPPRPVQHKQNRSPASAAAASPGAAAPAADRAGERPEPGTGNGTGNGGAQAALAAPAAAPAAGLADGGGEPEAPAFDAAYLANPPPRYPPLSRELAEQGRVLLRVLVGADGKAREVDLHRSSGYDRLDRAAAKAVWGWRFIPGHKEGKAVAGWVIVPVNFSLRA